MNTISKWSTLLVLLSCACGGGSAEPDNAYSAAEQLDWSHGAPAAEASFTEEQLARFSVCFLVSTTMFSAAEARKRGVTKDVFEADVKKQEYAEPVAELIQRFVDITYEAEFDEPVAFTYEQHGTCVAKVAEFSGTLAERAEFCLGRTLVAAAGYRMRHSHSRQDLEQRLAPVPGFGKPYLAVGHSGTPPTASYWKECLNGARAK